MKRVQLELTYDVLAENSKTPGTMVFYVEVDVLGDKDSQTWVKTGEFHNTSYAANRESDRISTCKDVSFTSHNYVVNLSEWRGQTVRIKLISALPKSVVTPQTGRWRQIRLVALSFDFIYDLTYQQYLDRFGNQQSKAKTSSRGGRSANTIQSVTEYTVGGVTEIPLNHKCTDPNFGAGDLSNIPDVGITSASINTNYFAYFSGVSRTITGTTTGDLKGTYGFRFNGSANLWSATTTLQSDLYRVDGLPYRFMYPQAATTESFDNNYLGISTNLTGTVGQTSTIHAFWQAEDVYSATGVRYSDWWPHGYPVYGRIGYARSTNGINFTRMHDVSGSIAADATPIITHWQTEEICCATDTLLNDGLYQPAGGVTGVANPSVIENGDYYYSFYTRLPDTRRQNKNIQGQWTTTDERDDSNGPFWGFPAYLSVIPHSSSNNEYFLGNMCVVRALKTDVNSTSYTSNANPWKKYYRSPVKVNGVWTYQETWTESGGGGYDTAILPTRGTHGKVSWNSYFQSYVMVTFHNRLSGEDSGYFIIQQSNGDNLVSWNPGARITEADESGKKIMYPSLIGGGNDRYTDQYSLLYYARDDDTASGGHYMVRRTLTFD